jgi:hypothetical protein
MLPRLRVIIIIVGQREPLGKDLLVSPNTVIDQQNTAVVLCLALLTEKGGRRFMDEGIHGFGRKATDRLRSARREIFGGVYNNGGIFAAIGAAIAGALAAVGLKD